MRKILEQPEHDLLTLPEQLVVLLATTEGLLDAVPLERIGDAEARLRAMIEDEEPELKKQLEAGDKLDDDRRDAILTAARKALAEYVED